ncbi:porin [Thermosulfuriphilus sp.]
MKVFLKGLLIFFCLLTASYSWAELSETERLEILEKKVERLLEERRLSKEESRFSVGGYGEIHANISEGKDSQGNSNDQMDIHRLVLYLGYDFSSWIKFQSEIELEHAYVEGDDGELAIEQAYVDFLVHPRLNFRIGRILTPLGIINLRHEPPAFYGVERPAFDTYIIPTTWGSDGAGVFGDLGTAIRYQLYVVGGLDGSKFDPVLGIRKGRIKERPSLNSPVLTGRIDLYPGMIIPSETISGLRLGASFYYGGVDNGNQGRDPGIDGKIGIYSGDFEFSLGRFDLRGALAFIRLDETEGLPQGVAKEMLGYYLEAGLHILPESLKRGRLSRAEAVFFVRYDDYDTQHAMPSGVLRDPSGDRFDWTFGLNFYPIPNLVLKIDYQVKKSDGPDPADMINLGVGWQF